MTGVHGLVRGPLCLLAACVLLPGLFAAAQPTDEV